ncbi:hypothetical protein Q6247_26960, partial [Klebsiella pneumoniae]
LTQKAKVNVNINRSVRFSLFDWLISHQTVFFSHNKSVVSAFQPAYKLKRIGSCKPQFYVEKLEPQ